MRYKRGTKISLNFRTVSGTKIRFFVQFFGIVPKYPTEFFVFRKKNVGCDC